MREDWKLLMSFLPGNWRDLAVSTGALKGPRKHQSPESLLRVLLMHLGCGHSLRETALPSRKAQLAELSSMALRMRLKKSRDWLQALCIELFRERGVVVAGGGGGPGAGDRRDDGQGAGTFGIAVADPLQRAAALARVRFLQAERDRGAWHGGVVPAVSDPAGRLPAGGPGVFHGERHRLRGTGERTSTSAGENRALSFQRPDGRPFDVIGTVKQPQSAGAVRAWEAVVAAPQGLLVPGRVCAIRKTAEAIRIAQQRLRKQARKKGQPVQPQTLEFAWYVIVFTTLPAEDFAGTEVLGWYRLRWQVELAFTRFKSLAQRGHLPKHDGQSARAWLYGKLIVALLVEKLIGHALAGSPWGYQLAAPSAAQRLA